jgi:hypothetical protein
VTYDRVEVDQDHARAAYLLQCLLIELDLVVSTDSVREAQRRTSDEAPSGRKIIADLSVSCDMPSY